MTSRAQGTLASCYRRAVNTFSQGCRCFSSPAGSRQDGMIPRLYEEVQVKGDAKGWSVLLDGRTLKTPGRHDLTVPSQSLALAIAAEWEYQDSRSIRPFTMPLMSLAATAIDQPKPRPVVIDTLIRYLRTDSLCLREEGHDGLAEAQDRMYKPIMDFYENDFKLDLKTTAAIFGVDQTEETVALLRNHLEGLDAWHLTATEALSSASRSVLIGIALGRGLMGPDEALRVARVEEDYQMEEWGLVEGGHDIDNADYAVRITAPLVFLQLMRD